MKDVVIVGGGLAGLSAAQEAQSVLATEQQAAGARRPAPE